ncbi:MAG: TatD family hydrolase [bacterium]
MELIDTHCHLFKNPLMRDIGGVLDRARSSGVHGIIVPAYDLASWGVVRELRSRDGVYPALGLHPWIANHLLTNDDGETRDNANILPGVWAVRPNLYPGSTEFLDHLPLREFRDRLAGKLVDSGAVAIGEIGLDFTIERPTPKGQFPILSVQLELAADLNLPVIVHCRNGWELLVSALQPFAGRIRGVLHGYTRPPELAVPFLNIGFYVGIGGALTRETAIRTRRSASALPLDRILIETDAPSMSMEGVDSGRTEPCHARRVAEAIAEVRGASIEDIARATTNNARELFRI